MSAEPSIFQWPPDLHTLLGGGVVTAVVGAVGWFIKTLLEDRKKRRKAALAACIQMQTIVGEWENAVREAVELCDSAPETIKKLEKSIETNHFNIKLERQRPYLSKENVPDVPECNRVIDLADDFKKDALDTKERLRDILENVLMGPGAEVEGPEAPGSADWVRAFYKVRKDAALKELLSLGTELKDELSNAAKKLVKKGAT